MARKYYATSEVVLPEDLNRDSEIFEAVRNVLVCMSEDKKYAPADDVVHYFKAVIGDFLTEYFGVEVDEVVYVDDEECEGSPLKEYERQTKS